MLSVSDTRRGWIFVVLVNLLVLVGPQAAAQSTRNRDRLPQDRVNDTFKLANSRLTHIDLDGDPQAPLTKVLLLDGSPVTLDLEPYTVRGANYRVLVQNADGELIEMPPGQQQTYRGEVLEIPGSVVAASVTANGLFARLLLPDAGEYWVEPAAGRIADAAPGAHVVYRSDDIEDGEACATDPNVHGNPDFDPAGMRLAQTVACGTGTCVAEIACDADVEFYSAWGSVPAVEERINAIINAVNIQYERDVAIRHVISTIIVRTANPDPYSGSSALDMLTDFRDHWNANHDDIPRDVAQLFTGRDINGSTIGIAYLNAICGSYAYGVVQSNFTSNFGYVTDLSAHELGHNWGAGHCPCNGHTMYPSITGANLFQPNDTIPDITAFRDSRSCLDGANGGCTSDAQCDDGNPCNGAEVCSDGNCLDGAAPSCDDNDPCTTNSCVDGVGCVHDIFECDDGDPCTVDHCEGSTGCWYEFIDCEDGFACTINWCEPQVGCQLEIVECPPGEVCLDGTCVQPICNNDAICNGDENCENCPGDCGSSPTSCCGDGVCEGMESGSFCEIDCGPLPFCGDDVCDDDESACSCPTDCGFADINEWNCADGLDQDCDGSIDCDDADCATDAACLTQFCGNGLCEAGEDCAICPDDCFSVSNAVCGNSVCEAADGEDCRSCPEDCAGLQTGEMSLMYCCGDGDGRNPVGCDDRRCFRIGRCNASPNLDSCCGNGNCEGDEDGDNCAIDCP